MSTSLFSDPIMSDFDQIYHSDEDTASTTITTPTASPSKKRGVTNTSDEEYAEESPKKKSKAKPKKAAANSSTVTTTPKKTGTGRSSGWTKEEDDLIIAKRKEKLTWKQITELINEGRNGTAVPKKLTTVQMRHRALMDRELELGEAEMQLLVEAETYVEAQKYIYVVERFRALCKEKGLAELDGISKAACEKLLKAHKKAGGIS